MFPYMQVLPVPSNEELKEVNQDTETYYVTDYKVEEENTHHSGGNKGNIIINVAHYADEEEEDMDGRGQTVRCQNQ